MWLGLLVAVEKLAAPGEVENRPVWRDVVRCFGRWSYEACFGVVNGHPAGWCAVIMSEDL